MRSRRQLRKFMVIGMSHMISCEDISTHCKLSFQVQSLTSKPTRTMSATFWTVKVWCFIRFFGLFRPVLKPSGTASHLSQWMECTCMASTQGRC
ncbi:hypothetical protein Ahy_A06g029981 isoform B [Arachis hypogaea]|uniref:Uncharacterized protein n=1 Tax=Arachis hypogaea TaxID=3818 RepID=A0A445CUS3_ARAHY|nr:hypothetical protein Ahy_A06g029981 isoform B [Arachis hypogaea]